MDLLEEYEIINSIESLSENDSLSDYEVVPHFNEALAAVEKTIQVDNLQRQLDSVASKSQKLESQLSVVEEEKQLNDKTLKTVTKQNESMKNQFVQMQMSYDEMKLENRRLQNTLEALIRDRGQPQKRKDEPSQNKADTWYEEDWD